MTNADPKTTADRPMKHNLAAEHWGDLDEGEFGFLDDGDGVPSLIFWPWGCSCSIPAALAPQRNGSGATWTLSGTDEAPTLHPSVDAVGVWHGFLTNGVARHV